VSEIRVSTKNLVRRAWMKKVPEYCEAVLDHLGRRDWEMTVVLGDLEFVRGLNRAWRGIDAATDVLSFPQGESPGPATGTYIAGDLVIALAAVEENARRFGVQAEEELRRVIVHGILHLAGMDHADNSPRRKMLRLQEKILCDLETLRFEWRNG
jgi:probable rRNA maturation factor